MPLEHKKTRDADPPVCCISREAIDQIPLRKIGKNLWGPKLPRDLRLLQDPTKAPISPPLSPRKISATLPVWFVTATTKGEPQLLSRPRMRRSLSSTLPPLCSSTSGAEQELNESGIGAKKKRNSTNRCKNPWSKDDQNPSRGSLQQLDVQGPRPTSMIVRECLS